MRPIILILCSFALTLEAHIPTQQETVAYRKQLNDFILPQCISLPEGGFAYCQHPTVRAWLEKPFDAARLQQIEQELKGSLQIPFTKEGFTQAVPKPEGNAFGEVSYSAIWVRDSCWHYYGLKIHQPQNAARLMQNLLRFYSSAGQMARFAAVIEKPELADPEKNPTAHMDVPLIRFSSKTLSHHQENGKDQEWNHLQYDSHGLFLLALSDALSTGILQPKDLQSVHYELLALFPAFFAQTNYAEKKDAGPWEEELLYNASSTGLAAAGLKHMMEVLRGDKVLNRGLQTAVRVWKSKNGSLAQKIEAALTPESIQQLYASGIKRVEKNLSCGGEAPNIDGNSVDRKADSALYFLCLVDHTPFYNDPSKIKQILNINSSLIGPYGIYRYRCDPYQAANYWIDFEGLSSIFGADTPTSQFVTRMKKGYMPHQQPTDAQWFFDSCVAQLYYRLFKLEKTDYYLKQGDLHLKRALAQLTGVGAFAANGDKLPALQLPESINTVVDAYYNTRPLPSPICPLSWSIASLQMAFHEAQAAHQGSRGSSLNSFSRL